MRPKWSKLASLAQKTCTLLFQFFCECSLPKDNIFKNIHVYTCVCISKIKVIINGCLLIRNQIYDLSTNGRRKLLAKVFRTQMEYSIFS